MKPIGLDLQPSCQLAALLLGALCLAIGIIAFMPLPGLAKALGLLVMVLSGLLHVLRDALLRLPGSWSSLKVDANGGWQAVTQSGLVFPITILPWSVTTGALTILCFRVQGRWLPSSVVIMPDSAEPNAHRQLRVWLRWAYRPSPVTVEEAP